LRFRPLIAPDQRGPNHFILSIEQNRAVHLSGESHTADRRGTGTEICQGL
jgi:nitrate/nitrite-specific signal transduction histidine kinase